jgi:Flp pilus assembly protein TadB
MYQGPNIFKEAANQKVSPDYAVSSASFGAFLLVAIAAGIVVAIITKSLLLGGIIFVGLIVTGVVVTMLLSRQQMRRREQYEETLLRESERSRD